MKQLSALVLIALTVSVGASWAETPKQKAAVNVEVTVSAHTEEISVGAFTPIFSSGYIAEATGEVIPEFKVSVVEGETSDAYVASVFKPPVNIALHQLRCRHI